MSQKSTVEFLKKRSSCLTLLCFYVSLTLWMLIVLIKQDIKIHFYYSVSFLLPAFIVLWNDGIQSCTFILLIVLCYCTFAFNSHWCSPLKNYKVPIALSVSRINMSLSLSYVLSFTSCFNFAPITLISTL